MLLERLWDESVSFLCLSSWSSWPYWTKESSLMKQAQQTQMPLVLPKRGKCCHLRANRCCDSVKCAILSLAGTKPLPDLSLRFTPSVTKTGSGGRSALWPGRCCMLLIATQTCCYWPTNPKRMVMGYSDRLRLEIWQDLSKSVKSVIYE